MCVSALVLSKGTTFCYAGLAGVVMRGRYAGITLRNLISIKKTKKKIQIMQNKCIRFCLKLDKAYHLFD